jgi:hypothetical protein
MISPGGFPSLQHKVTPIFRRALLVTVAVTLVGCGGSPEADPDSNEAVAHSDDELGAPPNQGGVVKIGARVICDSVDLLYQADSDVSDPASHVVGAASSTLKKGRYVLVQQAPGRVNGRLWIDPDLYGMRDPKKFEERFGKPFPDSLPPSIKRRGWIPATCLEATRPGTSLPAKESPYPYGDSKPWQDAEKDPGLFRVKHGCKVQAAYLNTKGQVDGYATYGTLLDAADALYVAYSTPSAQGVGGGIVFGYVKGGQPFHVTYRMKKGDANQFFGVDDGGVSHAADEPARWSYGYAQINGKHRYGWVWSSCLEKAPAADPAASDPPPPEDAPPASDPSPAGDPAPSPAPDPAPAPAPSCAVPDGFKAGPPSGTDFGAYGAHAHAILGSGDTGRGHYVTHEILFCGAPDPWNDQVWHHYVSGEWDGQWHRVSP